MALFFLTLFTLLTFHSKAQNQEISLLLQAKNSLFPPLNTPHPLSNWNPNDPNPCNWTAINCTTDHTVSSINFYNFNLSGPFPQSLCLLPNLSYLSLSLNYINSTLDSSLVSNCTSLTHLDLSQNYFVGQLPDSLASLPYLTYLDLSSNNFSGAIPEAFGKFPRIEQLNLVGNLLTGAIPGFLGGLSSLKELNLAYNPFTPWRIPAELGELSKLEVLFLAHCELVGEIPFSIGRLSRLINLDLSGNQLTGAVPGWITNLSSAEQIELYDNLLLGELPTGLGTLSSLVNFDASNNQIVGQLPEDIFDGPKLQSLHLSKNKLTGGVPAGVARSTSLVDLRLYQNRLNGTLPNDLGKNSPLTTLDLSDNLFTGEIPASICDRGVLEELLLIDNQFSGRIPEGLGRCQSLTRVRLQKNQLSGKVPDGFWGLPHVYLLELSGNSLSGSISPEIGNAANLSGLRINDNQFSGGIPSEIGDLSKLYELAAANNRLSGPLPASLGDMAELGKLDLHHNLLSGELLRGIKSWTKLTELNLADNDFTGSIPSELGDLVVLNYLDLSENVLMGEIPSELQNLKLNVFNVSNNLLSGPLPPLFATDNYRSSFLGNPGLCQDLGGMCQVSDNRARDRSKFAWLLWSIFVIAALVLVIGVAWFYCKFRKFKSNKFGGLEKSKWTLTSFHKLGFSEYEILDCLDDENNVIGSGASGKVYKAVLSNGEAVAVKKLWGTSKRNPDSAGQNVDDGFDAEVVTLGKIRHKNIVKLWCCCTHKDYKLLVYEYMPNGSLGDLLHSSKAGVLDWPTRYKIALDAAEGLSYLHHDCVPPIVHRDVKSNNILLDAEFGARVADFGVAKFIDTVGKRPKSMSVIAGSCGYIAPEYAYTLRVNEKSDTYSFGVVILELVTGKPPNDPEFGEKDLVKWVCTIMDQKGVDHVIDPNVNICYKVQINKVLNIGLLCTNSLPINRPAMHRVVKMLQEVVGSDNRPKKKDGKLSPYYYEDASDVAITV